MGNLDFAKQFDLIDFSRILKPGVIIGKYMGAVFPSHFIQRLITSLGENDGIRPSNGGQVLSIGFPSGADDVFIGFKQRVK
jgi:hypothetical protein